MTNNVERLFMSWFAILLSLKDRFKSFVHFFISLFSYFWVLIVLLSRTIFIHDGEATENNPHSEKLGIVFNLSELLVSYGSNQNSYPGNIFILL